MINNKKIIECEISFSTAIANIEEKYYGKLFYNCDNPTSHDSNHAVILNLDCNLDDALEDIKKFYKDKGLIPRIFQTYQEREKEIIVPFLKKHGFIYSEWSDIEFFYFRDKSKIVPNKEMKVRRVKRLDNEIIEMIHTDDESDRMVKVLQRHLLSERFHLLIGTKGSRSLTINSYSVKKTLKLFFSAN